MKISYKVLIFIFSIFILSGIFIIYYKKNQEFPIGPAPIYKIIKPISLEEFLSISRDISREYNLSIKLPTYLPDDLKPVAVWYKPFIAVIAFDNENILSYDMAKVTIEIDLISYPPRSNLSNVYKWLQNLLNKSVKKLREKGINAYILKIGDMLAEVIEKDANGNKIIFLYDPRGGLRYLFSAKASSPVSIKDLLEMVKSMKPVNLKAQ